MSLPDADRSAEGSEPRKERGGLLGALPRVARRRVSSADHEQDLGESSVDGGLRLPQCLLWGREAHRDRPPERGRIATALRAGPVERFGERAGLFECPSVGMPYVRMPSAEAKTH